MKIDYWRSNTTKYAKLFEYDVTEFTESPYTQILVPAILDQVLNKTKTKDKILDVGSGEGYLTRRIKKLGRNICGCDVSFSLIDKARQKDGTIKYQLLDIEKPLLRHSEQYHMVIANLVLMYLNNLEIALKNINRLLYKGGYAVFSLPHPFFNQKDNQSWFFTTTNDKLWITNYFNEKTFIKRIGNIFRTHHFHRTLETYTKTFTKMGFTIKEIIEPKPILHKKSTILKKAERIPFFIIFVLRKR